MTISHDRKNMKILFVPLIKKNGGFGHLKRCLEIITEIMEDGAAGFRAGIFAPDSFSRHRITEILNPGRKKISSKHIDIITELSTPWDFIIFDRKSSSLEDYNYFRDFGVVIGLDEGGESRNYLDYLIDILPLPRRYGLPNKSGLEYINYPAARRTGKNGLRKILLSFGGEDPFDLSGILANFLIKNKIFAGEDVSVVRGPFFGDPNDKLRLPENLKIVDSPVSLKDILYQYDIVFTSFGLTAYEAAASGCLTILFNPGKYHRTLSKLAGFPEIGILKPGKRRLVSILDKSRFYLEKQKAMIPGKPISIFSFLKTLSLPERRSCPVCGNNLNKVAGRFPERTFRICSECLIVYQISFNSKKTNYDKNYFFSEYKKQYGKTYLEDFPGIRLYSTKRLRNISRISKKNGSKTKKLLDIGCAYGPFLLEAAGKAYLPYGIDVSTAAIEHIKKEYNLNASCVGFEDFDSRKEFGIEEFDVITMWWVIEHFQYPDSVLNKVGKLLKPGGVFAVSTPNYSGLTARKDPGDFLKNSPRDHYTIWDPESAIRIFKKSGFRVKKVEVTGYHPERFPISRTAGKIIAPLLKLGDTFEVYSVKEEDCG